MYAKSVGVTNGFPVARDEQDGRTWLVHTYGAVSAGRNTSIDSGNGGELTVVIGHAPRELDRNVTVVGRVRQGIDVLSSLSRGTESLGFQENPVMLVQSVRLASEVPDAERTHLEVLRTDTLLFQRLIEARKNRREEWFHRPGAYRDWQRPITRSFDEVKQASLNGEDHHRWDYDDVGLTNMRDLAAHCGCR